MRYSILTKFCALLLAALTLLLSAVCVLGIVQAERFDLYTDDFNDWVHHRLEKEAYDLGGGLMERYAVRELSNCTTETLREMGYRHLLQDVYSWSGFGEQTFSYTITDKNGTVVESLMNGPGEGLSF